MKRWWKLIHPADRPVARKYLLAVLQKSNASLEAITDGLVDFKEFERTREPETVKPPKLQRLASQAQAVSPM